jgi:serine O-acetyltransferase
MNKLLPRDRDELINGVKPGLIDLLLSDLERYFFYNGQEGRLPRKGDLWRNFLIPRCAPVALYRVAHNLHLRGLIRLSKFVTWINFYLHGVEINASCNIGAYFYMPHASGAVIGAIAIGRYAVIYHQATLGAKTVVFGDEARPIVGDHVVIGSGAKVLGEITIGDGCKIGANSVVIKSLPPNVLAVGVPAKVVII